MYTSKYDYIAGPAVIYSCIFLYVLTIYKGQDPYLAAGRRSTGDNITSFYETRSFNPVFVAESHQSQ
jgi:hypothetical protein